MERSPQKKKRGYNTGLTRGSSRPRRARTPFASGDALAFKATLLLAGLLIAGCAVKREPYLAGHVGRATEQDVRAAFGEPTFMQPGDGGGIRWVYREGAGWFADRSVPAGNLPDCLEYHLTFDSRKVLADWTKTTC
jgi:hypothetical protein